MRRARSLELPRPDRTVAVVFHRSASDGRSRTRAQRLRATVSALLTAMRPWASAAASIARRIGARAPMRCRPIDDDLAYVTVRAAAAGMPPVRAYATPCGGNRVAVPAPPAHIGISGVMRGGRRD